MPNECIYGWLNIHADFFTAMIKCNLTTAKIQKSDEILIKKKLLRTATRETVSSVVQGKLLCQKKANFI